MRALKTLLIIVIALAALLGLLVLLGPAETHMVRTTTIAAPANVVYSHMNDMHRIDTWSPWRDQDSTVVITFDGPEGVGSKSSWEGKMLGKGSQTVTSLDPDKKVGVGLEFVEPFEATATADLVLEPSGDSTRVDWHYDAKNNWLARLFGLFMDTEKMMGPIFDQGLAKLKTMSEADAQALSSAQGNYGGFAITTVERPEMVYVGKRDIVKWDKISDYYMKNFPAAGKALGTAGIEMAGAPSGLFFKWDTENKQTDMMAAMPVKAGADTQVAGWTVYSIPAGKALTIAHYGDYAKTEKAHMAIEEMLKAKNLQVNDVVIEEYVTDPMVEKDTTKWLTNIYYMLK